MSTAWTIWKFPLPIDREAFEVAMPAAILLNLQVQDGVPVLWAAVMPSTAEAGERQPRRFVWTGTGWTFPDAVTQIERCYRGTVQLPGGIVLHLFEVLP